MKKRAEDFREQICVTTCCSKEYSSIALAAQRGAILVVRYHPSGINYLITEPLVFVVALLFGGTLTSPCWRCNPAVGRVKNYKRTGPAPCVVAVKIPFPMLSTIPFNTYLAPENLTHEKPPSWENTRPLSRVPAPTPEAHYRSIKDDISWNLYHVAKYTDVHHEQTTYGYYNRFLNAIFPLDRGFQVRLL